jgi:YfiR/HmsC-like
MSSRKLTYRVFLIAGALSLFAGTQLRAQKLNYELVSMYVYNFTKYIEWPHDRSNPDFVVGVYGESPVTAMLNKYISGKHVGQRIITVKVIHSVDEINACSIVFVPQEASAKLKDLSSQVKGKPILIVSEKFGQSKKGAGISIFLDEDDDEKTKFEINKTIITNDGLIISTNLLKLASQVY